MIPSQLLVHTIAVEVYEGSGAYGDVLAAPVSVPCYYEQTARMVRSPEGDDVLSQTQAYTDPPGTLIETLGDGTEVTVPRVTSGSRVTLEDGTKTTVITTSVLDDKGLTGLAHQEVDCE